MAVSTALALGALGAQAIGQIAGAYGQADAVYSPELEAREQQLRAIEDEQARQFVQEQRAAQAGQRLDVESAALRQGAAMAQQGAYSGRDMQQAALALQASRRQQEAEMAVLRAQEQMKRLQAQAQRGLELQTRADAARGIRAQGIAGALAQAGVQGLGVASQISAQRARESFQQQLLQRLSDKPVASAARNTAELSLGSAAQSAFQPAAQSAFQPTENLTFAEVPFEMEDATAGQSLDNAQIQQLALLGLLRGGL